MKDREHSAIADSTEVVGSRDISVKQASHRVEKTTGPRQAQGNASKSSGDARDVLVCSSLRCFPRPPSPNCYGVTGYSRTPVKVCLHVPTFQFYFRAQMGTFPCLPGRERCPYVVNPIFFSFSLFFCEISNKQVKINFIVY